MNKKGQGMQLNTVVRIVLLGVLLVLLIVIVPRAIRRVFKGVETAEEASMAQLEELKRMAEEKKEEHVEEVVEVKGYLVDALNFISGKEIYYEYKGSKVGGGTNINYDNAIEKYIGHYKKCGTEKPPGCLTDEAIKFRILNALREKYFMLGKDTSEADIKIIPKNLKITPEELKSSIILAKMAVNINNDVLDKANENKESYRLLYYLKEGEDELNSRYFIALTWYLNVKNKKTHLCSLALTNFKEVVDYTDNKFGRADEKDFITDFTALDHYRFLSVPNQKVKGICEAS